MIQAVIGLPRSGKSTVLSALADKALTDKPLSFGGVHFGSHRHYDSVYTTFPVLGAYRLDFDSLGRNNYHDCLILIDEVQTLCDSRNFKNFGDNLKFFFALHGHYNIDVVWASQSYVDADAKIRRLTVDYFLVEKKLFNFSKISPIRQSLDVSCGTISESYELGGFFACGHINRKKYYHLFDSFSRKSLPEPILKKWDTL